MLRLILFCAPFLALATGTFAGTIRYDCSFDYSCSQTRGCSSTVFQFVLRLDDVTGDAFIQGNAGLAQIQALRGPEATTFVEVLRAGVIQVTTVLPDGRASHSRHTIMFGNEFAPSQFYGQCQISRE